MSKSIKDKVLKSVKKGRTSHDPELIEPFSLPTDKRNQFLVFLKPEAFLDKQQKHIERLLDFVFEQFDKYGIQLQGAALFPGPAINAHQIMDRHYGFINELSKNASRALTKEEKQQVREAVGALQDRAIVGGHEALELLGISADELNSHWDGSSTTRIKSGFYARALKLLDKELVLVNGFFPKQLSHFTDPDRLTLVMVGSSNTPWKSLREEMVGGTHPKDAHEDSIRGKLNRRPADFGFESVNIDNNVIHFSAGPTEGLFEIDNFLGKPFAVDIILQEALLATKLKKLGYGDETIRKVLVDKELHSEAEHKDTDEVIEMIKRRYV